MLPFGASRFLSAGFGASTGAAGAAEAGFKTGFATVGVGAGLTTFFRGGLA